MTDTRVPNFAPPTDLPLIAPFWEATAEGRLVLPACSQCGAWQWYPVEGQACHPDAPREWRDVAHVGTVFTYTRVERGFLPSGGEAPYVLALVELDGVVGPRLVTTIVGAGSDTIAIGDRVQLSPTTFPTHTLPTFAVITD
jgi:hypothetical protein